MRHDIPIPDDGLLGSYLYQRDGAVRECIGGFEWDRADWKGLAARRPFPGDGGAALAERMIEYNAELGVSEAVIDKLRSARDGEASFVVTGQQPGALGGPLMTLYKIATAVALARSVESRHGRPCVPLYWMGADDVDFAEVREWVVPGADLAPLSVSIAGNAHQVAMPVGDIGADALEPVWKAGSPLLQAHPGAEYVEEIVSGALAAGDDHGAVAARIMASLTGGEVAVVDAREPLLRRAAADLYLEFFDREDEIRAAVASQGEALVSAGLHAQLALGPDSGVFLLEDGRRTKIPADRRQHARERIAADPSLASPGVVLRNLVQDSVFSPVAVILGPAEIAYRAQISRVYDLLGVDRPLSIPRMFATFLSPSLASLFDELKVPFDAAVTDPAALARAAEEAVADPESRRLAETFLAHFSGESGKLVRDLGTRLDDRAREKLVKRLVDIERRVQQALDGAISSGTAGAVERWPLLAHVEGFLSRGGKPQERYLSTLTPGLFAGAGAWNATLDAAAAFVDAALDGRPKHIVYSP